jgi:transposase InsO family protein
VESFFGTLKKELVHHRRYRARRQAKQDIFEWIEDLLCVFCPTVITHSE